VKKKLLVTVMQAADAQAVRGTGCEILAEYPNGMLVRATAEQEGALRQAKLDLAELVDTSIQVSATRFSFANAMTANATTPIAADPARTAYYIVKLVGPPKGEWLTALKAAGATVHTHLPGFALLVGMRPPMVEAVRQQPWVEGVSPYRPAMKVSPQLREGVPAELTAQHLAALEAPAAGEAQIEVSVFSGESTEAVAQQVRTAGGVVFQVTPHVVRALVPRKSIGEIAAREGVLAIIPYRWPKLHNDKAAEVMEAPANRQFADLTLKGGGQIVGVADTGLDSGVAATIAADFAGRVTQIVSWPNQYPQYCNDAPPYDDGPADTDPHGTHVAGSVLANGAAATAAGSSYVPQGLAPDAHVYFQAVQQKVNWKTAAQLAAAGLSPPWIPWPSDAVGLYGLPDDLEKLFDPAYTAGARLHTNSWGAAANGTYDDQARAVDDFMWNHRDMLVLFSAGNEGMDANADGVIDQGSMASPGTAKNCLTVGASENKRPHGSTPPPLPQTYDINWTAWNGPYGPKWPKLGAAGHLSDKPEGMAAFSSRGPTSDNRIKPDVVAPGTAVLSTRSAAYTSAAPPLWGNLPSTDPLHTKYCWSGGTSQSTPLVAGAAALVRQHLVEQRGHYQDTVKPSGALIKAFLVNGAVLMSPGQFTKGTGNPPMPATDEIPPEPDVVNGFGRVDATESLTPGALKRTLFADEPSYAVGTGSVQPFQVQLIDASQPLRVTLCWTDSPSIGAGGLVNQLYLRVALPDGTLVDGDVTPYPTVSNNVQRVVIPTPAAGTYEIRVHGVVVTQNAPSVPQIGNPKQDFALVVSNGMGMSLQPVSVALAIDTTGSMDYFGYMDPAKERANQFLDFLRINDKLSVTEFSTRTGVPDARTGFALRLMGSFNPDWTDSHAAVNALHADGFTPIGKGLAEAWNQLKFELTTRPRGIVLLSDGLNNVPPDPLSVVPTIPPDVPIFTIALGPAGNTPALQQIAASRPNGQYFVVEGDEDIGKLHQIYASLQGLATGMAVVGLESMQVSPGGGKASVVVDGGSLEAGFVLSWNGEAKELQFVATGPNGKIYKGGSAATAEIRGSTYRMLRIAAPRPGIWTVAIKPGTGQPFPCTFSATVRAALQLTASAAAKGAELTITAHLMAGREPVENAVVTAQIQMPTISRAAVQQKYAARLKEMRLPAPVLEKGLTPEQVTLTRLAALAREFRGQPGGLFGRNTVRVELKESARGTYRAEILLQADGNVTVEVRAAQTAAGKPTWTRVAQASVCCPAFNVPAKSTPKRAKTAVARKAAVKKAAAKKRK